MKIVLRAGAKTDDQFYGQVVAFAFLKTIMIEFLQLVTGSGSLITYIVYGFLLLHLYYGVIRRNRVRTKYLLVWLLIMMFFGLNYFLGSSEARSYYFSTGMIINYLYYLPIAIIVVDSIHNLESVYKCINNCKYLAIGVATIMLFFYSYSSAGQDNYMAFSYALLPFVLISFSDGIKEKKITSYFLFALGLFEIILYGARMPLTICILYAVVIYFVSLFDKRNANQRKLIRAVLGLFFAAIILVFGDQILYLVSSAASQQGSYSMSRILQGRFLSSSTRDRIYEMGLDLIRRSAGHPLWFFADRVYLGVIYVHNIFLEFMIDFGMYMGGIISVVLIWRIIVAIIKTIKTNDVHICMFLVFAVFARFLVSGSFLIEGMSFVFFAFVWKFCKNQTYENIESF